MHGASIILGKKEESDLDIALKKGGQGTGIPHHLKTNTAKLIEGNYKPDLFLPPVVDVIGSDS